MSDACVVFLLICRRFGRHRSNAVTHGTNFALRDFPLGLELFHSRPRSNLELVIETTQPPETHESPRLAMSWGNVLDIDGLGSKADGV